MNRAIGITVLVASCLLSVAGADDVGPTESTEAVSVDRADLKGRPQQDVVKVETARYFVWSDGQGWHLRTAAKARTQFSGSIRLENGSFIKLRPIGLDLKARNPDRWGVNDERTEVRFVLHTVGSFDGFDFDVRRAGADPKVVFDLKQGTQGQTRPKRIFLGKDGKHPSSAHFECATDPDADGATQEDAR